MPCEPLATLKALGDLLAPPRCGVCAAPCASGDVICPGCAAALRRRRGGEAPVAGVGLVAWAASYEGVARELVAALKFGGRLALAAVAAGEIAARMAPPPLGSVVVAVPAAALRQRRRGFDPAHEIAAALASRLGVACANPLRRSGSRRQVGRGRADRLTSPPRVWASAPVPDRVLLVDDVLTTGATLAACASALRAGGAREVRAAVFARTPVGAGGHEA